MPAPGPVSTGKGPPGAAVRETSVAEVVIALLMLAGFESITAVSRKKIAPD
jgi:hypothetical protein